MLITELKDKILKGYSIKRSSWGDKCVYYLSHSELSSSMKYGFGEYLGEPSFDGTFVLRTEDNRLVMGWQPNPVELFATDWEIAE